MAADLPGAGLVRPRPPLQQEAMPQPRKRRGTDLKNLQQKRAASPPAPGQPGGAVPVVLDSTTGVDAVTFAVSSTMEEAAAAAAVVATQRAEAQAEAQAEAATTAAAERRDSTRLGQQPGRRTSANESELHAAAWPLSERASQNAVNDTPYMGGGDTRGLTNGK